MTELAVNDIQSIETDTLGDKPNSIKFNFQDDNTFSLLTRNGLALLTFTTH
ncbi:MAG: hypothetical protein K0U68_01985 [Gammaproteobacteria bacterium]|nr:hypothetical protein [Gammaproteobacteria bacterium]